MAKRIDLLPKEPIILFILTKLKKIVDNWYYKKYHQFNQETLVRTMFPWIINVDSYGRLNTYLLTQSPSELDQLVKAIFSYYWAEVATLHSKYDYESVSQLKWLHDFALMLQSYSREFSSITNS